MKHERVVRPEELAGGDAGVEAVDARAGKLKFHVVARLHLGGVRFHGLRPSRHHFLGGDVDDDRGDVARFRARGEMTLLLQSLVARMLTDYHLGRWGATRAAGETHPALMDGWWSPEGDSILVVGATQRINIYGIVH